jgi:hypothetical protein
MQPTVVLALILPDGVVGTGRTIIVVETIENGVILACYFLNGFPVGCCRLFPRWYLNGKLLSLIKSSTEY